MSEERTRLGEAEALAFHGAFNKRREYMRAEGIDLLVDGEESVPLPGCPRCGSPADSVFWRIEKGEVVLLVDVDPCGHRFTVYPVTNERWLA